MKAFVTVFLAFLASFAYGLETPAKAQCYPGLACPTGETTAGDKQATPAASTKSTDDARETTASISPTFKCDESKSAAELVICNNTELIILDVKLDVLYMAAVQRSTAADVRTLRDEQRTWIQRRDACGVRVDCLKKEYQERIAQLSRQ